MTAKPSKVGEEERRVVSTVWRQLVEGKRGEPACGSWVLDGRWPDWEGECEGGEEGGRGDAVVSSVPVGSEIL